MENLKPNAPIRRFDVFAEYNRLDALKKGESAAQAKGYGIWLAKVVAAKKFRKSEGAKEKTREGEKEKKVTRKKKWRDLSGIPQTDKLFEKEIVKRMGQEFYAKIFAPAIQAALDEGKEYREIRDVVRKEWKPNK